MSSQQILLSLPFLPPTTQGGPSSPSQGLLSDSSFPGRGGNIVAWLGGVCTHSLQHLLWALKSVCVVATRRQKAAEGQERAQGRSGLAKLCNLRQVPSLSCPECSPGTLVTAVNLHLRGTLLEQQPTRWGLG